jgi:hypothetical protein
LLHGKRVVAFTPWGRELTGSILFKYLQREHENGILDEWWLCENTDDTQFGDRRYAVDLSIKYDWVKLIFQPDNEQKLKPKQLNTKKFYRYMTDPDTVFVRFDDDVVYLEENALERLVEARIFKKQPFVIFPVIWNNAVCSFYLQQFNSMPTTWGKVESPFCMDPVGWGSPEFAIGIHEHLLEMINSNSVEDVFMHHDIQLPVGQQFSVSSFAQTGDEYAKAGIIYSEEESWHTMEMPYATGRANLILSNSLVSHFSFYNQRSELIKTNILDRYRELSDKL